eukprot:TRINITY_DN7418_c0_g1_i1.p1 TRINITY_DN7418_c0_g1~~TRINITY_DN7418_c0_g1_i1.p1  ORF type:complete len:258 (+),score=46.75 TRINITY_DN7418_c0_g1_i1:97-870(+)
MLSSVAVLGLVADATILCKLVALGYFLTTELKFHDVRKLAKNKVVVLTTLLAILTIARNLTFGVIIAFQNTALLVDIGIFLFLLSVACRFSLVFLRSQAVFHNKSPLWSCVKAGIIFIIASTLLESVIATMRIATEALALAGAVTGLTMVMVDVGCAWLFWKRSQDIRNEFLYDARDQTYIIAKWGIRISVANLLEVSAFIAALFAMFGDDQANILTAAHLVFEMFGSIFWFAMKIEVDGAGHEQDTDNEMMQKEVS